MLLGADIEPDAEVVMNVLPSFHGKIPRRTSLEWPNWASGVELKLGKV